MVEWSLVVACNDRAVLHENLMASADLDRAEAVVIQEGYKSAASAYNDAMAKISSDIIVFAHQDVFLPRGWERELQRGLTWLNQNDPSWAVAGAYGTSQGKADAGFVYCTANRRLMGRPSEKPELVDSLDELLLILRKSAGLVFDSRLAGFHLYGTDICMQARSRAMNCYALPAFCIHNADKTEVLPWTFWRGYFYLRKKWRAFLPLATPCLEISKGNVRVARKWLNGCKTGLVRNGKKGTRISDPAELSAEIQRSFDGKTSQT